MKGYIIAVGVDGFGNDSCICTDHVYLNEEKARQECIKRMKEEEKEYVLQHQSFYACQGDTPESVEKYLTENKKYLVEDGCNIIDLIKWFEEDECIEDIILKIPLSEYIFKLNDDEDPRFDIYGYYETEII